MLEMLSSGLVMTMIILLLHVHPIKQSSENKHLTELTLHTTHDLTDVEDRSVTMSSVVEMVNRNWWKRTWTIQEVVLAQNPVLVCVGTVPRSSNQRGSGLVCMYCSLEVAITRH